MELLAAATDAAKAVKDAGGAGLPVWAAILIAALTLAGTLGGASGLIAWRKLRHDNSKTDAETKHEQAAAANTEAQTANAYMDMAFKLAENSRKDMEVAREELVASRQENTTTRQELAATREELAAALAQIAELQRNQSATSERLADALGERDHLKAQVQRLEKRLDDTERELHEWQRKYEELRASYDELRSNSGQVHIHKAHIGTAEHVTADRARTDTAGVTVDSEAGVKALVDSGALPVHDRPARRRSKQ